MVTETSEIHQLVNSRTAQYVQLWRLMRKSSWKELERCPRRMGGGGWVRRGTILH